ncbi:MAG: hypothetical protein K2H38_00865 [Muribaculaceae bacterium]|nr:hypothetical protein [Muribaculaceae bacterium]
MSIFNLFKMTAQPTETGACDDGKMMTRMTKYTAVSIIIIIFLCCCNKSSEIVANNNHELLAETDSIALYREIITQAKDEYDIAEFILWMEKKSSGEKTEILRTVRPDWHCWYIADGAEFVEVPIDSILALSRAYIWNEDPLKIIIEGCPDARNEFSYFIDVPSRKAYWIPANSGFLGGTEEGYMIFRSYRYVSDPEIAGRYTFLQVFNEEGEMVDSLDLEHVVLSKYQDTTAD